ncbi:MAG: DHH family phosphoesterase [Nanoarchaeota archaeon]
MTKVLVTSYTNPDLDGVSCMVGVAELLKAQGVDVTATMFGDPLEEVKWIAKTWGCVLPEQIDPCFADEIILVDTCDLMHLDSRIDPCKVVEIIDHRVVTDKLAFPNARFQIELVGAAATLVAERFQVAGHTPTLPTTMLLYAAIVDGTLHFLTSNTTDRDKKAADYLASIVNIPSSFVHDLFDCKSDLAGSKLSKRLVDDLAVKKTMGRMLGIAQIETVDVASLIPKRLDEILEILVMIKTAEHADAIFLNILDISNQQNMIVCDDPDMKLLLEDLLGVQFHDKVALRNGLLLRKQIRQLLV